VIDEMEILKELKKESKTDGLEKWIS
jgi:hypothetical protein